MHRTDTGRQATGCPACTCMTLCIVSGTLAAATGASLKELMARLGHSSTRAAMICQHATRERDQAIAKALGGLVQQVRATAANRRKRPAVTGTSRLLWPMCGPALAE